MRLLIAGATAKSLLRFRGPLLEALARAGHELHTCAGEPDAATQSWLAERRIEFHPLPLDRTGTSPAADAIYFRALRTLIREVDPDLVLSYTLKPVIFASLAARERGIRCACMITGAGRALQHEGGLATRAVGAAVRSLLRPALARCEVVFFQNPDDRDEFVKLGLASPGQSVLIDGSGVDLDYFRASPAPVSPLRFLSMARLLREKGILELAEAARSLGPRSGVEFQLLGPPEPPGRGLSPAELERVQAAGVRYLGHADDVRPYLDACSVFVLPSYYREGQPRSVLEALATGRAVVTTDAPGCRETVRHEVNGLLVPPRDIARLVAALARFITEPELARNMGVESRRLAVARYDVRRVNAAIVDALGLAQASSALPHSIRP